MPKFGGGLKVKRKGKFMDATILPVGRGKRLGRKKRTPRTPRTPRSPRPVSRTGKPSVPKIEIPKVGWPEMPTKEGIREKVMSGISGGISEAKTRIASERARLQEQIVTMKKKYFK